MDYHHIEQLGDENTHRFVLASRCTKPLVVIGVNPSTANKDKPDPTIRKVMGFAEQNNYDGFVMLNLYAQRSTDFNGVHKEMDEELHQRNLEEIRLFFKPYKELDVLVAWGNLLDKRKYLLGCFRDIANVLQEEKRQVVWKKIGELTKRGHPRHPLHPPYASPINIFDIDDYFSKR